MEITYRIDREHKVVFATAEGVLTNADFRLYLETLATDADYQLGFNELCDLRAVTEVEISLAGFGDIADFFQGLGQQVKETRSALLAARDNSAEISRLCELLRTNVPITLRLFRNLGEARKWLGLPDARSAQRTQVNVAVLFRAGIREGSARLVDISLSGALLESKLVSPERGRMVKIQFSSFDLVGTVVRLTESGFAVQFLKTTDELRKMLSDLS